MIQGNPYQPPAECDPPPERKPHWAWRKWSSSTVTVLPFWMLLVVLAIVTVIVNLLGTLFQTL